MSSPATSSPRLAAVAYPVDILQHPRVRALIQLCIVGQIRLAEQQRQQGSAYNTSVRRTTHD